MDMNAIGTALGQTPAQSIERARTPAATAEAAAKEEAVRSREDRFVSSGTDVPVTYSKNSAKQVSADDLRAMQQQRMESFTQMLQSMVTRQGQKSNMSIFGLDLTVSASDSAAARAAIAPGGEYSVEAVSDRILTMAKALSGGDPEKIELLRNAVQKGFKAAGVELGGKLPGICNDTYDRVMKGFDEWEKSSSASIEM